MYTIQLNQFHETAPILSRHRTIKGCAQSVVAQEREHRKHCQCGPMLILRDGQPLSQADQDVVDRARMGA